MGSPKETFGRGIQETGISEEERRRAQQHQEAAADTARSTADFLTEKLLAGVRGEGREKEQPEKKRGFFIKPYDLDQIDESVKSFFAQIKDVKLPQHFFDIDVFYSSLGFTVEIGVDLTELLRKLVEFIKNHPLQSRGLSISSKDINYFVQQEILNYLAGQHSITPPELAELGEERRGFIAELSRQLDDRQLLALARYVVSVESSLYGDSPLYGIEDNYPPEGLLKREAIGVAIIGEDKKIKKRMEILMRSRRRGIDSRFMVSFLNPGLRESFPLSARLVRCLNLKHGEENFSLNEYLNSMMETLYKESVIIVEKPRGPLPLEEVAANILIERMEEIGSEGIDFQNLAGQILETADTEERVRRARQIYPDIGYYIDENVLRQYLEDCRALSEQDQVAPPEFWRIVREIPVDMINLKDWVERGLKRELYMRAGKGHIERWRDLLQAFRQERVEDEKGVVTLVLHRGGRIEVYYQDLSDQKRQRKPLFELIYEPDADEYYPQIIAQKEGGSFRFRRYWLGEEIDDSERLKVVSYDDLRELIAAAKIRYRITSGLQRELIKQALAGISRESLEALSKQVDLEAMGQAGFYLRRVQTPEKDDDGLLAYVYDQLRVFDNSVYDEIVREMVRKLYKQRALRPKDIKIQVPLTGKEVNFSSPFLELRDLTFEDIQERLAEAGEDVRFPSISVMNGRGEVIRARALTYEALQKLKKLGFDAILGETMAAEFHKQASRIYVEAALDELGFKLSEHSPLEGLRGRQEELYIKALEVGFRPQVPEGYTLSFTLSGPLSWERERELIDFLLQSGQEEEVRKILGIKNSESIEKYKKKRALFEKFFDLAVKAGNSEFTRENNFPYYESSYGFGLVSTKSLRGRVQPGEFGISTQAKEVFEAAEVDWRRFISDIKNWQDELDLREIISLGEEIAEELDKMSQGELTDWAIDIIEGRTAAVGKDIQESRLVRSWKDFFEAIRDLLNTSRLALIYRAEKRRFGFEVTTDRYEMNS